MLCFALSTKALLKADCTFVCKKTANSKDIDHTIGKKRFKSVKLKPI